MGLLHHLTQFLLGLFYAHEFPVLFALVLLESAGLPLPLPGDTFITLAGTRQAPSLGYALALEATVTVAASAGASVLFWVMRRGGRPFLEKYGKYLLIDQKRLRQLQGWFARRGRLSVIIGWVTPGLRIPIVVLAGLSEMPYRAFLPAAVAASLIWCLEFYTIGALFATHRHFFNHLAIMVTERISHTTFFLLALVVALMILFGFYRRYIFKHHTPPGTPLPTA